LLGSLGDVDINTTMVVNSAAILPHDPLPWRYVHISLTSVTLGRKNQNR
jgi:hypothetical protein